MPANRGDLVLVLFPDSNLRTAKRRPALVVQADNLQTTVVEILPPDAVEVEFLDRDGGTRCVATLADADR